MKLKVPNTYVIIFSVLILCAVSTWLVPGGKPQTWQVLSALYEGFSKQAGIIAFVLIIGGAFWLINSTKAVDDGIMRFIRFVQRLERYQMVRRLGVGNIVIVLVMLLFGLFALACIIPFIFVIIIFQIIAHIDNILMKQFWKALFRIIRQSFGPPFSYHVWQFLSTGLKSFVYLLRCA